MTHLQMGAVLLRFDLQWPAALLSLFSVFDRGSTITSHVVSTECILKELAPAVSPFYLSSAITLLVLPICLVAVVNIVLLIRNARSAKRISNRAISIIILNMLYPSLTRQAFQLFACRSVQSFGGTWLLADFEEQCFASAHARVAGLLGTPALLAWVCGFPAGGALLLWKQTGRRGAGLGDEHFKEKYGFMYNGYLPEFYFWESIVMARKAALMAVAVFFSTGSVITQTAVASVVVLGFYSLQLKNQPACQPILNRLEQYSLLTTLVSFMLGFMLLGTANDDGKRGSAAATCLTIAVVAVHVCWLSFFLWHLTYQLLAIVREKRAWALGLMKAAKQSSTHHDKNETELVRLESKSVAMPVRQRLCMNRTPDLHGRIGEVMRAAILAWQVPNNEGSAAGLPLVSPKTTRKERRPLVPSRRKSQALS